MANNNLKNPIKATPAELSAKMRKLRVIYDFPKINLDSDDAVQERIGLYFDYCMEQGLKPNVEGLSLAIGIDRRTLWDWETGNTRTSSGSRRSDIIKKAKDYIAFLMSDAVMEGQINAICWIFYAKNYFGMKDTQEFEIKANSQLTPTLSPEEIAKQIPQDIPIEIDWSDE
ncbi:MAG: hypothetical protein K0R31_1294 [Clostridiales bacterium]|jgi:hypothetical protein|nr:hypothetical protein [Clostridiales bacterium]MDF2859165.1 hypothetical protein [Neobacillus sp.]